MTIGRIIGFAIGTILFGIGSAIGTAVVKKAGESIKKNKENSPALDMAVIH
jgi:hypothetical protein